MKKSLWSRFMHGPLHRDLTWRDIWWHLCRPSERTREVSHATAVVVLVALHKLTSRHPTPCRAGQPR